MKSNTCLVVDVWEGQLEVDEAILKANGVTGMAIRLNDMNGGHHMDTGFVKQWAEAVNFVRFPYFVYNPWVDGPTNYAWLASHVPVEVNGLAVDIEVRKTGYPSSTYATEFSKFMALASARWKVIIYSGQWFLPYLSTWPKTDYWWAQYPDHKTYFDKVSTWDELKIRLDKLDRPFNVGTVPGTCKMWQFSGDALILPGNSRPIDVNIFFGTQQEMAEYFGTNTTAPVTHNYYRVLHDTELASTGYKPRAMVGVTATPETIRLNGGVGNVTLSPAWLAFLTSINTAKAMQFLSKPFSGWLNQGTWPQVEQVTFAGNIVEVTEIIDKKAYIKTLYNDDAPPKMVGEFYDASVMHVFGVIGKDGTIDSPPAGNCRMLVMARNQKERLWIPVENLVKVDKLTVYIPPGTRLPGPNTLGASKLYTFNSLNYFPRPGGGPLTLPMSRTQKLGDNLVRVNWAALKPILARLNPSNAAAVNMIAAPDWGPSKGLDGDAIKWIGLLWPGRNLVQIEEILNGWGRVEGVGMFKTAAAMPDASGDAAPIVDLPTVDLTKFNANDNPNLVHMVYDYNQANGYGERSKPVFVPILGGPWWVDMSKLVSVDSLLPKTVKTKGFPRMNVRSGAGVTNPVVTYKYYGESAIIDQVKLAAGGLWGRISGKTTGKAENWIALRYNGTNLTDWKI